MRCLVYQSALSGDADSCERVIASDHSACHMRCAQFLDDQGCSGFELVFEDDEAQESKTALGLLALEALCFQPCQPFDALSRNGDNSITSLRVI